VRAELHLPTGILEGLGLSGSSHKFTIVWSYKKPPSGTADVGTGEEEECLDSIAYPNTPPGEVGSERAWDIVTRLFNTGLVLRDIKEDRAARERFWGALRSLSNKG